MKRSNPPRHGGEHYDRKLRESLSGIAEIS